MKTVWQGRVASFSVRASDYAPVVPACCNACRACTTTNVITLATAAALGAGALVVRVARNVKDGQASNSA